MACSGVPHFIQKPGDDDFLLHRENQIQVDSGITPIVPEQVGYAEHIICDPGRNMQDITTRGLGEHDIEIFIHRLAYKLGKYFLFC
jgi:hypothetical protein